MLTKNFKKLMLIKIIKFLKKHMLIKFFNHQKANVNKIFNNQKAHVKKNF